MDTVRMTNPILRATGSSLLKTEIQLSDICLARAIYRLSVSPYKENFVLKGGIFLYALYQGDYPRSTTDIDLLAQRISNAEADMKAVFTNVLSQETDDPLRFDSVLLRQFTKRNENDDQKGISQLTSPFLTFLPFWIC